MVIKTSKTKTQKTTRTSKTKSKNKGNNNMAWWHLLISALPAIIDGVKTLFSSGDKEKVKEDKISDLTELEGSTLKIGAQGVIKIG